MNKIIKFCWNKLIETWNSLPKIWVMIFIIAVIIGLFSGIEVGIYTIFILGGLFIAIIWLKYIWEWMDNWINLNYWLNLFIIWIKSWF